MDIFRDLWKANNVNRNEPKAKSQSGNSKLTNSKTIRPHYTCYLASHISDLHTFRSVYGAAFFLEKSMTVHCKKRCNELHLCSEEKEHDNH
jgi:hypothetical protein